MKLQILDKKQEGSNSCFLIKTTLDEYLVNLPTNYDSFEIQRSIVSNSYLDRLINTVLKKGHIPIITLVSENAEEESGSLVVRDFKILDGLQRTHRLKVIRDTKEMYLREIHGRKDGVSNFKIKRIYRSELSDIGSSGNILVAIKEFCEAQGVEELEDCFKNNLQWIEVWTGLTPDDEVRKMLVLNAGHKPVNIKHQLEIVFQNILPVIDEVKSGSVKIIREKDVSSSKYSKDRVLGEYHFSHLISALISYVEGKPVKTNAVFIEKIQNDGSRLEDFLNHFTREFMESFVGAIYSIDKAAEVTFGDVGIRWVGREVVLVALFAALGKGRDGSLNFVDLAEELSRNFDKCNLVQYEEYRNRVDLAKVNIGNINKKYIYEAFTELFDNGFSQSINWKALFSGVVE